MQGEYNALVRNRTWTLVEPPVDRTPNGNKWVFKVKRNSDGSISKYKARLVTKGFLQKVGIDFIENFSRVKPTTIRVVITHAISSGYFSRVDNSLFMKITKTSTLLILIYVDDIIVTGSNKEEIEKLIIVLNNSFSLKDHRELSYFLGIEVRTAAKGLHLSQKRYIKDLLSKSKMHNAKPLPTPMISNLKLIASDGDPVTNATKYRSIVGALQYITITRS
ncbi:hypothetical protein UlMin_006694 [Ulmus minor]